jgi:hypothetical protein
VIGFGLDFRQRFTNADRIMSLDEFPKLDKIRFFIVDEHGCPWSSAWFLDSRGDGVYAAPRSLSACKLSLLHRRNIIDGHDSEFGRSRLSNIRDMAAARPTIRWRRPTTPEAGAVQVATILFPADHLSPASLPPPDGRPRFALPKAASGEATEVSLFYSCEPPPKLKEKFIGLGFNPLGYSHLPNGEYVSFATRDVRFPADFKASSRLRPDSVWPLGELAANGTPFRGRSVAILGSIGDDDPITLAEFGEIADID